MSNIKKTFYITTPIYYPSGNLHIGHLYSTTIAWAIKNYKKKCGYDVKFLTGSDEHGQKIEKKAKEENLECQKYVDKQSSKFIDLWKAYDIDYDFFSRTTNAKHKKIVKKIFNKMLEKKYIYKGTYKGLYSINDEEFVLETQAIKINENYYHPISKHKLELIEEESYFFKMNGFVDWLIDYVKNNSNFILPSKRWNELKNNFLNDKLEDLSITRISFNWGIKIEKDSKHVIYVWLDALFNYISTLGFDFTESENEYQKYWKNCNEIVHVIGKEITRFHCIYWPIFLKSLDIKLPNTILSHGWIITPKGKMSKSKNNVINPLDLKEKFNPEIVKYYLISKINVLNDGIFSEKLLKSTYNSDLVNTIGNLVSRTISMINKNFVEPIKFKKTNDESDIKILNSIKKNFNDYKKHFDSLTELDLACNSVINLAKDLNKYIDLTTPWLLIKNPNRLEIILNILLNGIYAILTMIDVLMPNYVNKFKKILNIKNFSFDQIENFYKFDDIKVNKNEIIFPRLK